MLWIDNGSTDGTVEWLDHFASFYDWLTVKKEESNTGIINGRNLGFTAFLNDDKFKDCQYILF
jgi:glycosyltransferase involved in cell wall biosynthesis